MSTVIAPNRPMSRCARMKCGREAARRPGEPGRGTARLPGRDTPSSREPTQSGQLLAREHIAGRHQTRQAVNTTTTAGHALDSTAHRAPQSSSGVVSHRIARLPAGSRATPMATTTPSSMRHLVLVGAVCGPVGQLQVVVPGQGGWDPRARLNSRLIHARSPRSGLRRFPTVTSGSEPSECP